MTIAWVSRRSQATTKGLRVVIDGYWWVTGTQSLRGIVHGMIDEWASSHPDDELVIVTRAGVGADLSTLPANVRVQETRVWPHAIAAMLVVPWVARRAKADAMFTHNFSPLYGRGRTVLVHDAIFATNPEWFTRKELLYFRRMLTASRRAQVLFSTTATEGERLRRFGSAKRVVPVGLGLNRELIEGTDDRTVDGLVPERFVLTVGRLNVRKNLGATLEGARLSGRLSPDFPLVVVGQREGEWAELPDWVDAAIGDGAVKFTGFIDNGSLRWLLKNCALFVCLALDEGFGLPPVEARALGARVLVSDRPVFRETLQGEAQFVDPEAPAAIGTAIDAILNGDEAPLPIGGLSERHSFENTVRAIRDELLAMSGSSKASTPLGSGAGL